MSTHDSTGSAGEEQAADTGERHGNGDQKQEHSDDFELSEEGRKEVDDMIEAYKDKPTVVLPGSHGTITGTAINEWLDDEGNPKFVAPEEHPFAEGRDEHDNDRSESTAHDGQ